MESLNCFMDVERFVKWTYDNPDLFYEDAFDANRPFSVSTRKNWRRYKKLPIQYLEMINEFHLNGAAPFEMISIADFMLCITLAKDHNRGKTDLVNAPISSTGRKVLMLLLLGRMVENDSEMDSAFSVKKAKGDPLYEYLRGEKGEVNSFDYFPGRTVSFEQLARLGSKYRNNITRTGVAEGLKELVGRGLVECVDEENKLYKLDFDGCKKFLDDNTIS